MKFDFQIARVWTNKICAVVRVNLIAKLLEKIWET